LFDLAANIAASWSFFRSDGIRTEALSLYFDAFSSREPVSASLENALAAGKRSGKGIVNQVCLRFVNAG
jgi:hypothetical protein